MSAAPDRLDSWKAIADYLKRDVRTMRRWERQGLPVKRVPGGRGNSVYAYRAEIDAWLESRPADPPTAAQRWGARRAPEAPDRPRSWRARYLVAAAMIVSGVVGWKAIAPFAQQRLNVELTETGIIASDQAGKLQWRYDFPAETRNAVSELGPKTQVITGPLPQVFAMTPFILRAPDWVPMNGVLRVLTNDGQLKQTFSFDDVRAFGERDYSAPWALTDFRGGRASLHVVAGPRHHSR
jgi:hypothetical protein